MIRSSFFRWVCCAALAVVSLGACSAKTDKIGGETNWLKACDTSADCNESSCLCGACSIACSSNADCSGFDNATCADSGGEAASAQCGSVNTPVTLCLPACTRDGQCASDQRCVAGACVFPSSTPSGPYVPPRQVPNPTGNCVATHNGGRVEHSPNATDVYLPDCALQLNREYYRVFVQEDDTAYMIPRPDNHPAFILPCQDPELPFTEILNRYALCQKEAFTPAQAAAVNAMTPADALEIAHFLHEQLVFFVVEYGVFPGADASDVLDLCKADEAFRNGPMAERCAFELEAEEKGSRSDIGWLHTGEQGAVLADALNALYGIEGDELCNRLSNDASRTLNNAILEAPLSCQRDEDCVLTGSNSACHDGCFGVTASAGLAEIDRTRARVNVDQCASFERAECDLIAPSCVPPPGPACVAGLCGYAEPQ